MIMQLKKENLFLIENINEEEGLLERQKKNMSIAIASKEKACEKYKQNLVIMEKQLE